VGRVGDVTEVITRYNKFTEKIIELDLPNDIDSKPLLNVCLGFVCFFRTLMTVHDILGQRHIDCLRGRKTGSMGREST